MPKLKATSGSFRKGPDPRRHVFPRDECRLGLRIAFATATPEVAERLRLNLHTDYREKCLGNQTKKAGSAK